MDTPPVENRPTPDASRLCDAASAAYYAILIAHAHRTGECVRLPDLLCPRTIPPSTDEFSEEELDEGERFLVRLGMIGAGPPPHRVGQSDHPA